MIKLIVSDMDGTLLNSDKKLSPYFESIYKKLTEAGIQFVVASGRPAYALKPYFKHFEHDIVFVGENGGYIDIKPEPVMLQSFNKKDMACFINDARKLDDVHLILCSKDEVYIESKDEAFISEASHYYSNIKPVENLLEVNEPVLKVAICDMKTWKENSYEVWRKYVDQFVVAPSSNYWIDIMPTGINKGEAIKYIQKQLNINPSETVVFGDFHNDIQMLENAAFSYAMKNAHPDVKAVAKFEAPSNDEDGVVKVIEELILQKCEKQ